MCWLPRVNYMRKFDMTAIWQEYTGMQHTLGIDCADQA